jgi:hypothetical protein
MKKHILLKNIYYNKFINIRTRIENGKGHFDY